MEKTKRKRNKSGGWQGYSTKRRSHHIALTLCRSLLVDCVVDDHRILAAFLPVVLLEMVYNFLYRWYSGYESQIQRFENVIEVAGINYNLFHFNLSIFDM